MSGPLLSEFESMLNMGLSARAIHSFVCGFHNVGPRADNECVTIWHLATVLPLVFHATTRRAITKRRLTSGLRAILARDLTTPVGQNEVIFNINGRIKSMFPRTLRALNCAVAWGLVRVTSGAFAPLAVRPTAQPAGESRDILKAAEKLGGWAGQMSTFEYLVVLGVEIAQ